MRFEFHFTLFALCIQCVFSLLPKNFPSFTKKINHATSFIKSRVVTLSALQGSTYEITMPALSSTMTEGKIVQWLKEVGDEVQVGDAVMVVESDKADMDVESFEAGYLASIITPEGESASVGKAVAIIAEKKEDLPAIASGGGGGAKATAEASLTTPAESNTSNNKPTDIDFSEVLMPALSSTMTEGKIVQWLKSIGDKVNSGDAIMVVESDKADMDYEVFDDGYLAKIIVEEGSSTPVGAACAVLVKSEADIAKIQDFSFSSSPTIKLATASVEVSTTKIVEEQKNSDSGRIVASGHAKKLAEEMGIDLGGIKGTGPGGRIIAEDVLSVKNTPSSNSTPALSKPQWISAPGVIAATPRARALAKSKKIDLSSIKGTGNFGRVTEEDVKLAAGISDVKPGVVSLPSDPVKGSTAPTREIPTLPSGPKAMDGMQKAVAKNMEAGMNIPVFRVSRNIRTDMFDDLYRQLKPKGVTVSALLAKAAALAIESHPIINAAYAPNQIVYKSDINIAMAVAIDGGLITPTLKNANIMSLMDLSASWKDLVGKAKAKTLTPDEYNSGTFYISNLGMYGVSDFGALLPVGAGSILAIGGALPTVYQRSDGSFGVVKEMKVTITCDHRHIYGADAAEFLRTFADILESNCAQLLL